ncbi:MAG TPA: glucose-6-phosphate dehydrogenase [Crocinitomicaceae bacterium]|nr:glucose-6-phosphate dehydrogenase [Flavobacteriales bacterium]HBW86177.1 glucose-6-phosphate dehydrogenase [Crocinitomicaceae bacterium]
MSKKNKNIEEFDSFHIVVFGGDGDLALRKIYPALFHRHQDGQFSKDFKIIAITRKEPNKTLFSRELIKFLKVSEGDQTKVEEIEKFANQIELIQVENQEAKSYVHLSKVLNENPHYQHIYYFSTPSSAFGPIARALKDSGLVNEKSKVVIEKPLGHSLSSSNAINEEISEAFKEHQIYRIDHYLGKETVQNLMVLRFANNLFERAWDSEHIENIQITVAESLGVEKRAAYYDNSGALLDMVQNHLLQLLCLVAMEPPSVLEADEVRNEKLKVLRSLRPLTKKSVQTDTVKGQYTRGTIKGEQVNSYLEDIEKYQSKTETFVAIKAYVDNWRWKNVPFYLRTGKRMIKRYSEIVINFKEVRHNIFPSKEKLNNNKLIIRLQPEERIELVQMTKVPGPGGYRYKPVALKLDYSDSFKDRFPEAYERLIIDVIRGNQTLFMRQDELQAAWTWIESVTESWKSVNQANILYEAGSWGPGDLILGEDESWITKTWKEQ